MNPPSKASLIEGFPRVPTTSVDGVIVVWDISTKQTNKLSQ